MIDIEELERLATAATQGQWHWINPENDQPRQGGEWRSSLRTVEDYPTISGWPLPKFIVEADEICDPNMEANAAFIETFNPATALELIAENRQLREDLQAAKLLAHANGEMFQAEKAEADQYRQEQKDCQTLSFELLGVVIDTEQGNGFDSVCLDTIKRVRDRLHEMATTKPGS